MRGIILLVTGLILAGAGVFAYFLIGVVFKGVAVESFPYDLSGLQGILQYGVASVVGGLGALFILFGLLSLASGSKKRKQDSRVMQTGVDAEADVKYVDKNYNVLVNRRPIYSIVEYTYQDSSGNEHTNRIENVNSEQVIRNQIEVGSRIAIKYAAENPGESVIVM